MNKYIVVAKEATDTRPKPLFFSIKAVDGSHEVETINKATWFGDSRMAAASYRSFHNGMRGAEAIHRRFRVMPIKDAYEYMRNPRKYRVEEIQEPDVPTIQITIPQTTTERKETMNNEQNNQNPANPAEAANPADAQPKPAAEQPKVEQPKVEEPTAANPAQPSAGAAPEAAAVDAAIPGASNPDELHKQINGMSTTKKIVIGGACVVALAAIGVGVALLLNRGNSVVDAPAAV